MSRWIISAGYEFRFGGEPNRVDANHRVNPRTNRKNLGIGIRPMHSQRCLLVGDVDDGCLGTSLNVRLELQSYESRQELEGLSRENGNHLRIRLKLKSLSPIEYRLRPVGARKSSNFSGLDQAVHR